MLTKPLNVILGSQARVEILRTFFKYPGEFTGRHVARLCQAPQANIQRHLKTLETHKILSARRIGTSKAFTLNTEHILHPILKKLFNAESELLHRVENLIAQAIKRSHFLKNELAHASLYGSVARREEAAASDIDVFLLFKNPVNEDIVAEKFENLNHHIMAISGMRLHLYSSSFSEFDKQHKRLLKELKENSRLIYGQELNALDPEKTSYGKS